MDGKLIATAYFTDQQFLEGIAQNVVEEMTSVLFPSKYWMESWRWSEIEKHWSFDLYDPSLKGTN